MQGVGLDPPDAATSPCIKRLFYWPPERERPDRSAELSGFLFLSCLDFPELTGLSTFNKGGGGDLRLVSLFLFRGKVSTRQTWNTYRVKRSAPGQRRTDSRWRYTWSFSTITWRTKPESHTRIWMQLSETAFGLIGAGFNT